jgi:hypothetical protein
MRFITVFILSSPCCEVPDCFFLVPQWGEAGLKGVTVLKNLLDGGVG